MLVSPEGLNETGGLGRCALLQTRVQRLCRFSQAAAFFNYLPLVGEGST